MSSMLSDHFLIGIDISLKKQSVSAKVILCRKYKLINKDTCVSGLRHLMKLYDSMLWGIVEEHSPLRNGQRITATMVQ